MRESVDPGARGQGAARSSYRAYSDRGGNAALRAPGRRIPCRTSLDGALMPELPEVEALAHHLREHALYRPVARVDVASMSAVKTFDPPMSALRRTGRHGGRALREVPRRRVPRPARRSPAPDHPPLARGLAALARHRRHHPAQARQGPAGAAGAPRRGRRPRLRPHRGGHTEAPRHLPRARPPARSPAIARLGPDALAVTREEFAALLVGHTERIKTLIVDQAWLAGVGNAYSDEILHTAKLSPYAVAGGSSRSRSTSSTTPCARCSPTPSSARSARAPRRSRARSAPGCACTPAPGCRARCAGRPSGRCRSPTGRSSTVRAARPAASPSPTGGFRDWCGRSLT